MATEPGFPEESEPEALERGWKERLTSAWHALASLVATRVGLFKEELAEKKASLAGGAVGVAVGLVLGWLALLLFTALIVSLLTLLFDRLWAGLLATLALYLLAAAIAIRRGIKALSRVRPFSFPATLEEIRRDWSTLRRSAKPYDRVVPAPAFGHEPIENLETRFREGSE